MDYRKLTRISLVIALALSLLLPYTSLAYSESDLGTWSYSETDTGGFLSDEGVVSGKRRVEFNHQQASDQQIYSDDSMRLDKTLTVVNAQSYDLSVSVDKSFVSPSANPTWGQYFSAHLIADGVEIDTETFTTTFPQTINLSGAAVASGTSMAVQVKIRETTNGNTSVFRYDFAFDWYNFSDGSAPAVSRKIRGVGISR